MRQITILYPALHYPPVIGGLEQWTRNIAERQPEDIKIIIVTGRVRGEENFEHKKNILIFRTSFFELKNLSHSSWLYILTALPFIFFKSFQIALKEDISLFHCHGFLSGVLGYKLSIIARKPFIGTEQSVGWGKSRLRFFRGLVYRRTKLCIAVSGAVAEEFIKIGVNRNNIQLIPNGVDLEKFYAQDRTFAYAKASAGKPHIKAGFVILSVGRLEKVKGHKYLIEAFVEVKKKIPGARLVIIGNGSERKNLESLASGLGLEKDYDVKFLGEIAHDKLPEHYRQADIFVMPSIQEGFGITVVEAMASGVPVIATRTGGHLDIIESGKNGILVEPADSNDIAQAMLHVYNNPEARKSFVDAGLKKAQEYSWDSISSRVTNTYKNFANKPRILIVCSIFPPEVGGPAMYAKKLINGLTEDGYNISVAKGIGARSFIQIFKKLLNSDICYVLTSSPRYIIHAYFAAKILGKKLAIRVGGDFFWERAYEEGRTNLPLRLYYSEYKKNVKEKAIFLISKYIFKNTDFVIFTSRFLKNLYIEYYRLSDSKCRVIENAYSSPATQHLQAKQPWFAGVAGGPQVILCAGRLLKLKNLDMLIRAFADVEKEASKELVLKIIGEGPEEYSLRKLAGELNLKDSIIFEKPVPQDILFQELKKCWIAVLPSISEVSPNFVLESIACGAPIIITRETGLAENITKDLITFDPRSKKELASAIISLLGPIKRQEYKERINAINTDRDFSKIIKEHEELF